MTDLLMWLRDKPDGILYDRRSSLHRMIIFKHQNQIQLYFADPAITQGELTLSGIMSRIDLDNPLDLLGIYTQAMMMALLWQPEPKRIYVLGFAGGRIPMLFHHYFPDAIIESTDIDELIPEIAKKYFGIVFDERQDFHLEDGRDYLERRFSDQKFDIILIDAFRGTGRIPYKFGTVEFYELCKRHMTPDAVVCMNIINQDNLFTEKLNTFRYCFKQVYFFAQDGTYILFGTNREQPLERSERQQFAEALQAKYQFSFPLVQRVLALADSHEHPHLFHENLVVLTDTHPPIEILQQIPSNDPIFYKIGSNESCPCGSQLKYKKCHGKRRDLSEKS